MTSPPVPGSRYELTVVGKLGPVLRAIVEPAVMTSSGQLTIIRLRGHEDLDLVDVLDMVGSRGLDAVAISAIH